MKMARICADLEILGRNGRFDPAASNAHSIASELEGELEQVRREFQGQLAKWALEETALG